MYTPHPAKVARKRLCRERGCGPGTATGKAKPRPRLRPLPTPLRPRPGTHPPSRASASTNSGSAARPRQPIRTPGGVASRRRLRTRTYAPHAGSWRPKGGPSPRRMVPNTSGLALLLGLEKVHITARVSPTCHCRRPTLSVELAPGSGLTGASRLPPAQARRCRPPPPGRHGPRQRDVGPSVPSAGLQPSPPSSFPAKPPTPRAPGAPERVGEGRSPGPPPALPPPPRGLP